jgi:hypothetical protein
MGSKQLKSYPLRVPFRNLAPRIWTEDDDLYIKTSLGRYVLSLSSYRRIVNISKPQQIVEIKTKRWWRWERPIRIPFSTIDYLDLNYPEPSQRDDEYPDDTYELFLITSRPSKRVHIFTFGHFIGYPDPIYREMAKSCADLIAKLTNIRIGMALSVDMPLSDFKDKYVCKACGHRLHPSSESVLCPYCGGKEIRIE